MNKVAKGVTPNAHPYRAGNDEIEGPWVPTPRWHPASWFGWTIRKLVLDTMGHPDGERFYEYGRPRTVARRALRDQFGTP